SVADQFAAELGLEIPNPIFFIRLAGTTKIIDFEPMLGRPLQNFPCDEFTGTVGPKFSVHAAVPTVSDILIQELYGNRSRTIFYCGQEKHCHPKENQDVKGRLKQS